VKLVVSTTRWGLKKTEGDRAQGFKDHLKKKCARRLTLKGSDWKGGGGAKTAVERKESFAWNEREKVV